MNNDKLFYDYIIENAADPTDDPAGDFILDAEADSFFPQDVNADEHGFIKILNYLYFNRGVWDRVLDAFMDVWQEYYRDITGSDWIEDSFNKWNYIKRDI